MGWVFTVTSYPEVAPGLCRGTVMRKNRSGIWKSGILVNVGYAGGPFGTTSLPWAARMGVFQASRVFFSRADGDGKAG